MNVNEKRKIDVRQIDENNVDKKVLNELLENNKNSKVETRGTSKIKPKETVKRRSRFEN